jgi:polyhydroxyalkanoate synthesis regulator phasin
MADTSKGSGAGRGRGRRASGGRGKGSAGGSRARSSARSTSRPAASRSRSGARASSARSGSKRSAAARKGGKARGRQQTARAQAGRVASAATAPADRLDISSKNVADFRELLTRGLIAPLNLLLLTRERIEEVMNDAVSRGRMTTDDAQDLIQGLVNRGRRQTTDVVRDLEQLLGRGRSEVESRTARVRSRAVQSADPVLAQADRARRAAGVGPVFPISVYDDLTAAQVQSRLGDLSPAELRKVRDYERRNANRKSVLTAIESKLG